MTTPHWPETDLAKSLPDDFMARRAKRRAELEAMTKSGVIEQRQKLIDAGIFLKMPGNQSMRRWSKSDLVNSVLWSEGLDPYDPRGPK